MPPPAPARHAEPRPAAGRAAARGDLKVTVEFDPEPLTRIAVGETLWLDLNPEKSNKE